MKVAGGPPPQLVVQIWARTLLRYRDIPWALPLGQSRTQGLSFVLATSGSAGRTFLSARLFVVYGSEGTKDGKASGKKGLVVHEEQTSHLTGNHY